MWAYAIPLLHFSVALVVVLRVLARPRLEPSVRLAWIMVIEALPVVGIAAYLLFGEIRIHEAERQKRADFRARLSGMFRPSPDEVTDPPDFARTTLETNLAISGLRPVARNRVTLLDEDDAPIEAMVDAVERARNHVHALFYIWLDDRAGRRVAHAIAAAARRGVTCRVVVDAVGSRSFTRSATWREMAAAGVQLATAHPVGFVPLNVLTRRLDLRNHRKIMVVDNAEGFTGSRNIAGKEFAAKRRFGPWVDVLFRLEGPVLRQMQAVFLADWMSYTGEDLGDTLLEMVPGVEDPGTVAQVISTGPDRLGGGVSDAVIAMLHAARRKVVITTPYFVPSLALESAIRACARRGVSVTLILPERNDSIIVGATSQGFWYGQVSAGVRLVLFRGGLIHAKLVTVDGKLAMMGSANLDRRSFELNYEMNVVLLGEAVVAEIDRRQDSYIARGRDVRLEEIAAWSRLRRIRNNLLALAAPLL